MEANEIADGDPLQRLRSPVLETPLKPFPGPAVQVFRTEICNRITATDAVRLILIHAPAGFGKSTAMLQVRARLEAQGVSIAWLTLDRIHDNPAQFVEALGSAAKMLDADDGADLSIDLVHALLRHTAPFAIFIDCFELIEEHAVLTFLKSVIERLPPNGRLIIASRTLPPIGLARLRGSGRLLEIGPDEMRFSMKESEQYFRLRSVPGITHEIVVRLHEKTEGWITGLWLASLSIERQGPNDDFVARFSGSTKSVADYLSEEVFALQPESLQRFLLQTSILRHFTPALCQSLLPDIDAAETLQLLEDQNLFVIPVSGQERTFRYHSLFADYLRKRLASRQPEEMSSLHLAAARWFATQNRPIPAIDHAICAGDFGFAVSMLAGNGISLLEQGRMSLLSNWLDTIPSQYIAVDPLLEIVRIWATLFTHGPWTATERMAGLGASTLEDPRVTPHIDALRPLVLAMQDRYQEAREVGPASIAKLPTGDTFADSVLCNAMATIFASTGDAHAAQAMIDYARTLYGDSAFNYMYAESLSGILDLRRGKLKSATAKFRLALKASRGTSYSHVSGNSWAGILYAAAMYETNELDAADQLINIYLPMACDAALPDHMIIGHRIRARIAFDRGDIEKAFETLSVLEHLGHRRRLPRLIASARLERGLLHLLQGDGQASREELDHAANLDVWNRLVSERLLAHETNDHVLASIRWEIHFGDAQAALANVQTELEVAAQRQWRLRAEKLRALQSLALQKSGEPAAAIEALATTLRQTSREGFFRLLVEEGAEFGKLVARFFATLEAMPAKRSDPVFVQYVARLVKEFGLSGSRDMPVENQFAAPLTRKEIRVLQLVADGKSNAEITAELAISDSTVRTHLRSINQKLNARSRAEAAAIGRRLDIVR